jgi:hypothetical protein
VDDRRVHQRRQDRRLFDRGFHHGRQRFDGGFQ